jgi:3-oxoacyl-[acyl-carrier protein] reductase
MKLKGKVALITGSSRGIGAATAMLFAKEGARVVINYKEKDKEADKVVRKIGKENCLVVKADVSKEKDVKRLVNSSFKKHKRIDILVNNAGEILRPADWKMDVKTWKKTLDINLTSIWLMTREIAPLMQKRGSGVIINLTSTVGILGVAPVLAYSAAKSGLLGVTKAFAKELAPEIRVNAVAPSNVMTDMTKGAGKELIELMRQQTPLKRIAEPEELAKPILFLASDDASYITGEVLVVDGGYSLK